jgi:D-lactate dehydrogenase (quinone)
LQAAAAAAGFFWPPDPGSADYCTVGGNLACNAAGPRALKYGTPRENTLGLEAVTGAGRSSAPAATPPRAWSARPHPPADRLRGTLAIITEATLKLTPLPERIATVRAAYTDMHAAAAAVSRIMAQPVVPRVLEFLDGEALALLRARDPGDLPRRRRAPDDRGRRPGGAAARRRAGAGARRRRRGPVEWRAAADDAEAAALWAARKALSPALRSLAPHKINEDVVVPVSRIPELTDGLAQRWPNATA